MRHGGRGGAMVVTAERQHAAMLRGAGGIAVLEDIHRAVDAGALAVPDRIDAVIVGAGEQVELLAATDRGGGEVVVHAGLELDVIGFEEFRSEEHTSELQSLIRITY